jgi:hypothetical protein
VVDQAFTDSLTHRSQADEDWVAFLASEKASKQALPPIA